MGDVIMGQKPDGKFSNVQLNSSGQILTSPAGGSTPVTAAGGSIPVTASGGSMPVTVAGRATDLNSIYGSSVIVNNQGENTFMIGATGMRVYLTDLIISNENTTPVFVRLRSGSGGSITDFMLVKPMDALVLNLTTALRGNVGEAMRAQCLAAYPANIRVVGVGYVAP